jgi:hypothetical protein
MVQDLCCRPGYSNSGCGYSALNFAAVSLRFCEIAGPSLIEEDSFMRCQPNQQPDDIGGERFNNRPLKVLDFLTPNEVFAKLVADAQSTDQQCCASD